MAGDTERLRQHVRQRMAELRIKDLPGLSTTSGVPVRTINNILAGHNSRARYAVEVALQWAGGSIEQLLAGGEATPRPRDPVGPGNDSVHVSRKAPAPLEAIETVRQAMDQANAALAELARSLAAQNPEADQQ